MFCQNCGSRNQDTAKFCKNCGQKIFQEEEKPVQGGSRPAVLTGNKIHFPPEFKQAENKIPPIVQNHAQKRNPYAEHFQKKERKDNGILMIIGAVILVGVAVYLYNNFGSSLDEHSKCSDYNKASSSDQQKVVQSMGGGSGAYSALSTWSVSLFCALHPNDPIDGANGNY